MAVTKIVPPYRAPRLAGGDPLECELSTLRLYGVIESPTIRGTVLSPNALKEHQADYGLVQEIEAQWRGLEWQTIKKKSPPEMFEGIALNIFGTVRLTSNRVIHVIADDETNHVYTGEITLSIREGDPELSRVRFAPAYGEGPDAVPDSLNISSYINRAQLEFLFKELGRGNVGLGFMLDVVGFQFGPEQSFAAFHHTQDYYLEQTAVIREFSISTHSVDEISVSAPAPADAGTADEKDHVAPVGVPPDARSYLGKLVRGVRWLLLVAVAILGVSVLRACALH